MDPDAQLLRVQRRPGAGSEAADRISRSVAQAHAGLLLAFAVMVAMPLLSAASISVGGQAVRWGVVAAFLVAAAWMFRSGERLGQLVVVLVALITAAPWLLREHIPGETPAGMLIFSAVLLGARVFVPWATVVNALVAWGPFAIASAVGAPVAVNAIAAEDFALATAMAMAAVGFVNSLEVLASQASQGAAFTRARRTELLARAAQSEAVTHAQRVLHDDVLGTLHLLVNNCEEDPAALRAHCRRTAETVRQVLAETDLPDDLRGHDRRTDAVAASYAGLVRRVLDLSPIAVDVEIVDDAATALEHLPPARVDALERGVLEALRNVHRHAGVSRATMVARADRQWLHVHITDSGVGMARTSRPGFGQNQSIRGAMAAAGGRAVISSEPGGGTTVALRMPRGRVGGTRLQRTYNATVTGLGVLPMATRSVALPLILVWCLIGSHQALISAHPLPNLGIAAGWAALSVAVLARVEARPPDRWWVLAIATATCLLQVLGLALLPAGALLDYRSWSIGFSAVPMVLFVFVLPVRVGLAVIATQPAIVFVAATLEPSLSAGAFPFGALNAPVTAPLAALLLGVLVRRTNAILAAETARATALEHALLLERARADAAAIYFDYSREQVLPWLDGVADAVIDPLSEEARTTAQMLAIAARDDLYAPGFFDDSLRDDVARFREQGGSVELRAGLTPGASGRSIGRVLDGLLPLSAGRRIIVSPPAGVETRVRIAVVPPPREHDLAQFSKGLEVPLTADVDEFRAVLLVEDLPVKG